MSTTVAELLALALPRETRVLGGKAGLNRAVTWATLLRDSSLDEVAEVEEDQFIILATPPNQLPGDSRALSHLIDDLALRQVAGLAILGDASLDAIEQADRVGFPLLSLPPTPTRPQDVERAVIAAVLQRQAQLEQRGLEIAQRLTQLVMSGRGLAGVLEGLIEVTGGVAVLLDTMLNVRASVDPHQCLPPEEEVQNLLRDEMFDRPELFANAGANGRRQSALSRSDVTIATIRLDNPSNQNGVRQFPPGCGNWALVAFVLLNNTVAGYLWLLGDERPTDLQEMAVRRAAEVCAIELARQQSIAEAQNRLYGDFIEALLSGRLPNQDAALAQARQFGFSIDPPYVALVFQFSVPKGDFDERQFERVRLWLEAAISRELNRQGSGAITWVREDRVIGFCPVGANRDIAPIRSLAEQICARAMAWLDSTPVSVGIGRIHPGMSGMQETYREAEQAVLVGAKLFGSGRVTYFGDLGVYRLLFHLQGTSDLQAFYEETLAKLIDYDTRHGAELVRTLEAFFAHLGNLSRVAEALFVHRNTLAYRIQRIEEITGASLDDPEDRLALQFALKVKDIVLADKTPPPYLGKLHKYDRLFFSKDRLEP